MILFTTGDILALLTEAGLELPPASFDRWSRENIFTPVSGGIGTGNHRQWSLMQAVGFLVAIELYKSDRGCAVSFLGVCVTDFGKVSEEWLAGEIVQGRHFYCRPHLGRPLLTGEGKQYEWPNVAAAYKRVLKYAEKKQRTAKGRS